METCLVLNIHCSVISISLDVILTIRCTHAYKYEENGKYDKTLAMLLLA